MRQKLSAGLEPVAIFATARWMTGPVGVRRTTRRIDYRAGPNIRAEPTLDDEPALSREKLPRHLRNRALLFAAQDDPVHIPVHPVGEGKPSVS